METCEVLIVGGGPAGAACAWKLRKAGFDVLIADSAQFPRDKVCAGWITPPVIQELELDRAEYAEGRVLQPFTGFRTSLLGSQEVTVDYGQVISYGVRRREFDHYLLQRSGARLRLGERIRQVRRAWDTWLIDDAIRARVLVGAGGHFCPVARQLPDRKYEASETVVAQELEIWISPDLAERCSTAPEIPDLFFCRDLRGYGWCERKGEYLNIGLGRLNEQHLNTHVEHFVHWLKETKRIPAELPTSFQGHAYALYSGAPTSIVSDGVLLIGDAAGLAYDASGEGIRPAIESGLLAAQTIIEARGDYGIRHLRSYETRLRQRFGERTTVAPAASHLPKAFTSLLAERLLASRTFSRRVVLDRWFLHRDVPPLAA